MYPTHEVVKRKNKDTNMNNGLIKNNRLIVISFGSNNKLIDT